MPMATGPWASRPHRVPNAAKPPHPSVRTIRNQRVILDSDLATLYAVPTFRFNAAVKRNAHRFPEDFRFQLTKEEAEEWRRSRSQNAILKRGQNITSADTPRDMEHVSIWLTWIFRINRIIENLSTDYTDIHGLLNNSMGRDDRPGRPIFDTFNCSGTWNMFRFDLLRYSE